MSKKLTRPSLDDLRAFLAEHPRGLSKNAIARAFGISGEDDRRWLRETLKELSGQGVRKRRKNFGERAEAGLVEATLDRFSDNGDAFATSPSLDKPIIIPVAQKGLNRLKAGDRVAVKIRPAASGKVFRGELVRRLPQGGGDSLVGQVIKTSTGFVLRPADPRVKDTYFIHDMASSEAGDVVIAHLSPATHGNLRARIGQVLGKIEDARLASLIALHAHCIPVDFPEQVLAQAEKLTPAPMGARLDWRHLPFVTIDGEDARDFDDAVMAEPDPAHAGGFILRVAIADVSAYVTPASALDHEALRRGNSVYFTDRVVPMLPEALSNDLCSLREQCDRPCLAAEMQIDAHGNLRGHRIMRVMIYSRARLTYTNVQRVIDGDKNAVPSAAQAAVANLIACYDVLNHARRARGTLDLIVPEYKARLDARGQVVAIDQRLQNTAQKLIEEMMIAANVAAAETLTRLRLNALYRVHDQPSPEKINALREFLEGHGLRLAKGQSIKPIQLTHILDMVKDKPFEDVIHQAVLRAQAQAGYSPDNIGHFGLHLPLYAHFTSPIRRYADLVVHRALIAGLKLGDDGQIDSLPHLANLGDALGQCERRATLAERDAFDRYAAAYWSAQLGKAVPARISSITRHGLFVRLGDSGVDGLLPLRSFGAAEVNEKKGIIIPRRGSPAMRVGDSIKVELAEIDRLSGRILLARSGQSAKMQGGKAFRSRNNKPRPRG